VYALKYENAYTSNTLSVFGFIGSRITKTHDFGFVALDMTHVRGEDEGVYICRASNALGEAVTTASMKIRSKLVNCIDKVTAVTIHCCTLQACELCGGKMFVTNLKGHTNVRTEIENWVLRMVVCQRRKEGRNGVMMSFMTVYV
jgi:hypothetical protein